MVRRQVVLVVRTVVDVPVEWTEEQVRLHVEQQRCKSHFIMPLAEAIAYDDEEGECHICGHATARLIPIAVEVKSEWLDKIGCFEDDEDENENEEGD